MPWTFYCRTAHKPLNQCIYKKVVDDDIVECNFSGSCEHQADRKTRDWLISQGLWGK